MYAVTPTCSRWRTDLCLGALFPVGVLRSSRRTPTDIHLLVSLGCHLILMAMRPKQDQSRHRKLLRPQSIPMSTGIAIAFNSITPAIWSKRRAAPTKPTKVLQGIAGQNFKIQEIGRRGHRYLGRKMILDWKRRWQCQLKLGT